MSTTSIEWCARPGTIPAVWNPVTGCRKVSEGCRNCYAESVAWRWWHGRPFTDVRCHEDRLMEPYRWRKPRTCFVNSMSDLFHEDVPLHFLTQVWAIMSEASGSTFLVLTKRPERMRRWMADRPDLGSGPPANVWLGVSAEDQATADRRIPLLLQTPAVVRFVSCEPLLGPVDLTHSRALGADTNLGGIDWIIVGGESGPHARPMRLAWASSLVVQARDLGASVFVKQLGARPVVCLPDGEMIRPDGITHPKGGDPAEWPEDLRVREWPEPRP